MKRRKGDGSIVMKKDQLYLVYQSGEMRESKTHGKMVPKQVWECFPRHDGETKNQWKDRAHDELKKRTTAKSIAPSKHTLEQFTAEFIGKGCASCKPQTLAEYESTLRMHILPMLGRVRLGEITRQHVEALHQRLLSGDMAVATAKKVMRLFKAVLFKAADWEYIDKNPCPRQLKWPHRPKRRNSKPLTKEQVRLFIDQTPEDRKCFFIFAIISGMREGELFAAKWEHLDWKEATYTVTEQRTRGGKGRKPAFESCKTERSEAVVELPDFLLQLLKAHKAKQNLMRWNKNFVDNGLIFCNRNGSPLDHWHVSERWYKPILEAAGLPKITFHALRKTSGSLLLQKTGNLRLVQKHLRHADIATTARDYAFPYEGESREAFEEIGGKLAV